MNTVFLHGPALICALGNGPAEVAAGLFASDGPHGGSVVNGRHRGTVDVVLPSLADFPLPLQSRNNALLAAILPQLRPAVEEAVAQYGAARVAIVIGTSTSGIREGEQAIAHWRGHGVLPSSFHYAQQELGSPADFLRAALAVQGPAWTVSTACSSGAKAIASAARMLNAGLADAVVCGGVDALCELTVAGFTALESVSATRCNPMSRQRNGINIGEGAALFVASHKPSGLRLAGWGESSDAHHISAPDPQGRGAMDAMWQALQRARVTADVVDYLALHGTATVLNDLAESRAVEAVLGREVACSSTKPLTGHTLGAAGALNAAFCALVLDSENGSGRLPPHWWDGCVDPDIVPLHLVAPGECLGRRPRAAMSNAFAFGGNNSAILLAAE